MPVIHGGDFHSFFSRGVDLWQLSADYGNGSCFFLMCGGGGLRPPAVVGWLQLNPVAGELVGDGAGVAGHGGRGGGGGWRGRGGGVGLISSVSRARARATCRAAGRSRVTVIVAGA